MMMVAGWGGGVGGQRMALYYPQRYHFVLGHEQFKETGPTCHKTLVGVYF